MEAAVGEPRPYRWTRDEYYKMASVGLFENQRVELIEGRVVEMSPQGFEHLATVSRVSRHLQRALGETHWVLVQAPLNLGELSDPEPDIYVAHGSMDDYDATPTSAALVVEVSDTTLVHDRVSKASLYAKGGIPEYWICNLMDAQLEVHRTPQAVDDAPYGFSYADREVLRPGDAARLDAVPGLTIPVADLLPQ